MSRSSSSVPSSAPSATGPYSAMPRLRLVTVEQVSAVAEGPTLSTPSEVRTELHRYFEFKDREHFVVLHLDGAHRVTTFEVVSVGILNATQVHPREVFKSAILANAAAIICAHNHPSGNLTPSAEDRRVFERLTAAGELLGIRLLDFVIVAGAEYWSAEEHGTWPPS